MNKAISETIDTVNQHSIQVFEVSGDNGMDSCCIKVYSTEFINVPYVMEITCNGMGIMNAEKTFVIVDNSASEFNKAFKDAMENSKPCVIKNQSDGLEFRFREARLGIMFSVTKEKDMLMNLTLPYLNMGGRKFVYKLYSINLEEIEKAAPSYYKLLETYGSREPLKFQKTCNMIYKDVTLLSFSKKDRFGLGPMKVNVLQEENGTNISCTIMGAEMNIDVISCLLKERYGVIISSSCSKHNKNSNTWALVVPSEIGTTRVSCRNSDGVFHWMVATNKYTVQE